MMETIFLTKESFMALMEMKAQEQTEILQSSSTLTICLIWTTLNGEAEELITFTKSSSDCTGIMTLGLKFSLHTQVFLS